MKLTKSIGLALSLVVGLMVSVSSNCLAETDVTSKVQVIKSALSYDRVKKQSFLNVSVKNISSDVLLTPIKVVIDSVSPSTVVVANADGKTAHGKPYFSYTTTAGTLSPSETTSVKVCRFNNPTTARFIYTIKVMGTVSTPEAGIEKAITALNAHDMPTFVGTVASDEQSSMQKKLDTLGADAASTTQTLAGFLANAAVVEQTATTRKMRTVITLPDGTNEEVFFDMVLENGVWRLKGL